MSNDNTWWEKTVEYAFVAAASHTSELQWSAPLSGKEERAAGDAIFSADEKLVLVEFKCSKSGLTKERRKFLDKKSQDEAKFELAGWDGHHHFVYSADTSDEGIPFKLIAETYFSRKSVDPATTCLSSGVDGATFANYLAHLIRKKKPDPRGGGAPLAISEFSKVVAVSKDGNLLGTIPIGDYCPEHYKASDTHALTEIQEPHDEPPHAVERERAQ